MSVILLAAVLVTSAGPGQVAPNDFDRQFAENRANNAAMAKVLVRLEESQRRHVEAVARLDASMRRLDETIRRLRESNQRFLEWARRVERPRLRRVPYCPVPRTKEGE